MNKWILGLATLLFSGPSFSGVFFANDDGVNKDIRVRSGK